MQTERMQVGMNRTSLDSPTILQSNRPKFPMAEHCIRRRILRFLVQQHRQKDRRQESTPLIGHQAGQGISEPTLCRFRFVARAASWNRPHKSHHRDHHVAIAVAIMIAHFGPEIITFDDRVRPRNGFCQSRVQHIVRNRCWIYLVAFPDLSLQLHSSPRKNDSGSPLCSPLFNNYVWSSPGAAA